MLKQIQDIFDGLHDDLDFVQLCDNTPQEARDAWDEIYAFWELYKKKAENVCVQAVEHPGNEPPDTKRNVQIVCSKYSGWITAFYDSIWKTWRTDPGLYDPLEVLVWRELPPVPEVTK